MAVAGVIPGHVERREGAGLGRGEGGAGPPGVGAEGLVIGVVLPRAKDQRVWDGFLFPAAVSTRSVGWVE